MRWRSIIQTYTRREKLYPRLKACAGAATAFFVDRVEYYDKLYPRLKPFLGVAVAFVERTVERYRKLSPASRSMLNSAAGFVMGSFLAYLAFGARGVLFIFVVWITYVSGKIFLKIFAPDV